MEEPVWVDKPEVPSMEARTGYAMRCFLLQLATSYAFGIARNHPFVDGNKRTTLVVSEGFLRLNGLRVAAPAEEKYFTFLGLAAGTVGEAELAGWFARHVVPI